MKYLLTVTGLLCFALSLQAQQREVAVISSEYDESNAVLAPDGRTLYFTIGNHILNAGGRMDPGDIWYSQVDDEGNWSNPVRLQGQVNTSSANRVLGFSSDGLTMFLHGHYGKQGETVSSEGISVSNWNGRTWTRPMDIQIPYFTNKSRFQSGYISDDESILLFSIESYKTIGNEDIYVSFKTANGYSEPRNLGPDINTRFQEFTPYLSPDKTILFFSTNGREGRGSSDVFYSRRLDDSWTRWTEPENVGNWVNTDGRDWNFLMIDKIRKILFISTRSSNGYGDIHILRPVDGLDSLFSELPEEEIVMQDPEAPDLALNGVVQDQVGVPLSSAKVTLSWEGGSSDYVTGADGSYAFDLLPSTEYTVHAEAIRHIPQNKNFNTGPEVGERTLTFRLLYAEVGMTVNLENVLFRKGTDKMLPGSQEDLRLVIEMMRSNPGIEIELSGHTDNNGDSRKNLKLSKQRVKVIRQYLIDSGINGSRISGKGYGDTRPIASNSSEETRRLNRRVEFTIVKN